MELNAEQVIKDLECCRFGKEEAKCKECNWHPWTKPRCWRLLASNALSLIKKLTAKTEAQDIVISELRWSEEKARHDADRYALKIKELTEENERLIEELAKSYNALDKQMDFYCSFTQSKIQNCPIDDEIAKAKADTVRKMQSEIEARCIKGGIYPAFVKRTIDRIAKEMMEGSK